VDPRAGLDDMEKRRLLPPPGLELRPLSLPARSQSNSVYNHSIYRTYYNMFRPLFVHSPFYFIAVSPHTDQCTRVCSITV
jgi:hypothetical protein